MGLQLVERGVVGQVLGEVLLTAEGVEVGEDRVALDLARILHPQVVRVGVHAHDLLLDLVGSIRQVDAVTQRLGHLGLAVGSRQTHAGGVVGQQDLRFDEGRPVDRVELVHDLARLLDHRLLVLARRDRRGLEGRDVRGLADGVGEEADGNAGPLCGVALDGPLGKSAERDLGLDGRVALEALHRHEIHVVEGQLAQFGDLRLDEERRFPGVEACREVVERHLDDVLPHLFGVVGVVGERLCVGDHDEYLLELPGVLQFDTAAERTHIVPQVEAARRTVAREDDFSHCFGFGVCFVVRPATVGLRLAVPASGVHSASGRIHWTQTYEKPRARPKKVAGYSFF